jgi:DNA-binding NarL/FixJ family response regulator
MIWMNLDADVRVNDGSHIAMPQVTRLIIIDRRALFRECIASSFQTLTRKIEILRSAEVAHDLRADELACADVVMLFTTITPVIDDPVQHEITRLLFERPDAPIVLLGDSLDADEAGYVLSRWHLRGYIPTSSTLADAEGALDTIVAGGTYLPPARSDDDFVNVVGANAGGPVPSSHSRTAKLTSRERMVLLLLREGMPNKIIAHRLGISQSTVKAHIHSIMTKLHARNRTETAVLASARFPANPLGVDAAEHRGRRLLHAP